MKFLLAASCLFFIGCATKSEIYEGDKCVWDGTALQCESGTHYEKPVQRSPAVVEEHEN